VIKASVGLAAAACAPAGQVQAQQQGGPDPVGQCGASSATEAGPFYPTVAIPQRWDLTTPATTAGQLIYVFGVVHGRDCLPAPSTSVTFWQTDYNGSYNHPAAENQHPLVEDFLYFGQWPTQPDGAYLLKTVAPMPYQFRGLRRAPHIHFAFTHGERGQLTTELYFNRPDDVRRREGDVVWGRRDRATRDRMIVDLHPASTWPIPVHPIEANALWCRYDVTLA